MKYITTFLILITVSLNAQKTVNCDTFLQILNENRILALKNNSVGIIDFEGNIIVPFKYQKPDSDKIQISSKLFATSDLETNKKVLLDIENGNNILKQVTNIRNIYLKNDYAVMETGQNYRDYKRFYIDSDGEVLFELPKKENGRYFAAFPPHEDIIRLAKNDYRNSLVSGEQEFVYYTIDGKKAIDKMFKIESGDFYNSRARNSTRKEGIYYYGFIDTNGVQKIDFKFSNRPTDFSDDMSVVQSTEEEFGYINRDGEVIIEPKYEDASGFYKGYALVKSTEEKRWFLIDKQENIIEKYDIKIQFPHIYPNKGSQKIEYISVLIDEGFLSVNSNTHIINLKGEILFEDKKIRGANFKNGFIIYNSRNSYKRKTESFLLNTLGDPVLKAVPDTF